MSPPAPRASAATILDLPVAKDGVVETPPSGSRGQVRATQGAISSLKVFSATKARDREVLGERVTAWIAANPAIEAMRTDVSLRSDRRSRRRTRVLACPATE